MAKKKSVVGAAPPELFSAAETDSLNRETKWAQTCREMRGCMRCPLSTAAGCGGPMPGQGNYQRPWIAFVLEAPSKTDNTSGVILNPTSPSGVIFDRLLTYIGMSRENVLVLYAVSCLVEDGAPPDEMTLNDCVPHMVEQLRIAQPHVIVACGWAATCALLGHSRALDEQVAAWRRCMDTTDWQYWRQGGATIPWRTIHHPSVLAASARTRSQTLASLLPVLERVERSTQGAYRRPAHIPAIPLSANAVLH